MARFDADGTGEWIELVHGRNGLDAGAGFRSQADVLVNARGAGDAVKATRMDRPEWIAVHPRTGEAYCALTNNSRRGAERMPGPDAANPRPTNDFGHIVRWRERGGDAAATRFEWDVFILAGDPAHAEPGKRGNIRGDLFGSPDGLWFDERGVLWIQTDVSTSVVNKGEYAVMGNNQMLACDPSTREVGASSSGRPPARSPGWSSRPTGGRCSSTSSTLARARASGRTRPSPRRSAPGRTGRRAAALARPPSSSRSPTGASSAPD